MTIARMYRASILVMVCCFAIASWCADKPRADHNFDRYEPEIAAFELADQASPPPEGALLFIGSSTIGNWKTLAADFPRECVINRGFGGSEIVDITHFADRIVFPYKPRMIVVRSGANELHNGWTPQEVLADFTEFARTVRAQLPETEITFISLSPTIARWGQKNLEKEVNRLIAAYVRLTPHLRYVETYDMVLGPDERPRPELFVEDQLHLSADGYRLLAERVRSVLVE